MVMFGNAAAHTHLRHETNASTRTRRAAGLQARPRGALTGPTRARPRAPSQFNGGSQVQITYGDTFISGTTGRAPMAINGTFVNINATSGAALPPDGGDDDEEGALEFTQGVVVASSVAGGALGGAPRRAPWDGLLGMGRPALAVGWMQPPVVSMAEQGRLPAAVFGLWLSHDARGEGRGGELALGGWNAARTQGGVHWCAGREGGAVACVYGGGGCCGVRVWEGWLFVEAPLADRLDAVASAASSGTARAATTWLPVSLRPCGGRHS